MGKLHHNNNNLKMVRQTIAFALLVTLVAMMVMEIEASCSTKGCCNCSRQTSGKCAITKNFCLGKCHCESKLGVCTGKCGGVDLLDVIPGIGRKKRETLEQFSEMNENEA